MKKTKILVSILATVLVLASIAALGIISSAETVLPSIDYCTLVTKESVYIRYYVPEATADGTKILIWTSPEADGNYTAETADDEITEVTGTVTVSETKYKLFDYKKLASRQMGDFIYARAYDGENYSKLNKYSILTYAYNTLGKTKENVPSETIKELLEYMLLYGAASQKHFNYNTDKLVTNDFYQVSVADGGYITSDGSTYTLGSEGETVEITAPATNAVGETFSHWENSSGATVSEDITYTVTIGTANETYTPVYEEVEIVDIWDGTIATSFGGGTGTEEDPYLIYTGSQLAYLANETNDLPFSTKIEYYKLMNDIDLNGNEWTPIGIYATYDISFGGIFDGNGCEISNFKITTDREYNGLFGYVKNGEIKNLGVSNFIIDYEYTGDEDTCVGGLVG